MAQGILDAMTNHVPTLTDYDVIAVSSSAGKDSQTMLRTVVQLATAANVLDRVVVIHADLGKAEWAGTQELAAAQAAHYGLPFIVCTKVDTAKAPNDLLDRVRARGMWPSSAARWCTSDHKRGPIQKVFTQLAKDWRTDANVGQPCRILDCIGMRAQESSARAKRQAFTPGKIDTKNQRVDEWLPIQDWTETQVWDSIRRSGVAYHEAYDLGMSRLSCVFCVLASPADLRIAAKANPALAAEYVAVEVQIGHTFKNGQSLAEIIG